jgi:hypothetical protein
MARRRIRQGEYTTGWVCALLIELAAVQEMLDEEYDLEQDAIDNNLYSLGRIGDYNIVIVCLSAGLIGNNPAAAIAMQMRSAFRSLRFGMMVGIGGGVLSAELTSGSGTCSQPAAPGLWGVIQYDFGKTIPSGFHRTGFLNSRRRYYSVQLQRCGRTTYGERVRSQNTSPSFAAFRSSHATPLGLTFCSKQRTIMREDQHVNRAAQTRR